MRGLTKEEAARLAKYFNPDPRRWGALDPTMIDEHLIERGSVGIGITPAGALGYAPTPLGKLALRVHQLCVERGLA